MNCERFEQLLSDALGGELSTDDRTGFESHLANCSLCRDEYESLRRVQEALRSLPGPIRAGVGPSAGRLTVEKEAGPRPHLAPRVGRAVVRYAAVIFLAFFAGYASHATLMLTGLKPPLPFAPEKKIENPFEVPAESQSMTLEAALVQAITRRPHASHLQRVAMALFPPNGK